MMALERFDEMDLERWIEARFSRSPGPGGQNVNKVNTQVTLLFDFESCSYLTRHDKSHVRKRLATRISRDGRLRVVSRKERTQAGNRRVAAAKLVELIALAIRVPKKRKPTRPTASSIRRRLEQKRLRSDRKRDRRQNPPAD